MESPEDALRQAQSAEASGDLVLAESILRGAVKKWKREPEFKMRYGRVLRKLGRDRRALKIFRAVLKSHPQRADAAQAAAESSAHPFMVLETCLSMRTDACGPLGRSWAALLVRYS